MMGLWRGWEAVPSQGSDGGRILHPPLVAPAGCHGDPGAGASFHRFLPRRGEAG